LTMSSRGKGTMSEDFGKPTWRPGVSNIDEVVQM
jgi:hypothetical protein